MARGRTGIIGFLAFAAMVASACIWILGCFNLDLGTVQTVLNAAKDIIFLAIILYVAYDFAASTKGNFWKFVFWFLAIVSIASILIGVGVNFAE